MQKVDYTVRAIKRNEWEMAMQLAWDTFLVYEAPEYGPAGMKSFHDFVKGDDLKQLFLLGEYEAYGAFNDDVIIGIIGVRRKNHISLLFVEPQFHHQGIARALCQRAYLETKRKGINEMTVNSSPYAVMFYHKLGFLDMDKELTTDGIRYTPMVVNI